MFESFDKDDGEWDGFVEELERNDWFKTDAEFDLLGGLAGVVDSRIWQMVEQRSRVEVQEAILHAGIALYEHRASHGEFPAELPQELQFDDVDGDGQLHYQPQDDGFLLYSVGRDKRDDGGPVIDENGNYGDDFGIREPFVWTVPRTFFTLAGMRPGWKP